MPELKHILLTRTIKIPLPAAFILVLVLGLIYTVPLYAHENQAAGGKKTFTKHFQETLFDITEHAAFSVEVLLDDREYKIGKGVVGIVIHDDKDSDVKGAGITVVQKNLDTGESVPETITITDKDNGLYILSGLNLERQGRRELSISIKKGNVRDSVTFILPDALKKHYPKGKYTP
jgi:hypothetical protein